MHKTPLNEVHRAAGAKMVDFVGWELPIHYGSQIDEHHSVRRDAGMFDVCHMTVVDIRGAGARPRPFRVPADSRVVKVQKRQPTQDFLAVQPTAMSALACLRLMGTAPTEWLRSQRVRAPCMCASSVTRSMS